MSVSARDHSRPINPLLQDILPKGRHDPVYWNANGIYAYTEHGGHPERVASIGTVERWFYHHSIPDFLGQWSRYMQGHSILVEHTSVNPVHPLHAGSLRGSLIGGYLVRLFRSAGAHVSSRYFVNDHGRQTRLLSWILQRTDTARLPSELRFDHAAAVLYALVNMFHADRVNDMRRLRHNYSWLDEVVSLTEVDRAHLVKSLSEHDPPLSKLWHRRILENALSDLQMIGSGIDKVDYESTLPTSGTDPVELSRHVSVALVNGSLCLRLNQGLVPLTRADGSWLYFTRDVLNTRRQLAQSDHVVHVIGDDQELLQRALQSLFPPLALDYVGFGVVTDQGRRLSARQNRLRTIADIVEHHGERGFWQLALTMMARQRQRPIDLPQHANAGPLSLIIRARRAAENGYGLDSRGHRVEGHAWPVVSLLLRTPAALLRSLHERSPHPLTQLLLHVSRVYLQAASRHRVNPQIQSYFLQIQRMLYEMHGLPLPALANREENPA